VARFLTGASLVQWSHLKMAETASKSRYLQTRQEIRKIRKTRNQLVVIPMSGWHHAVTLVILLNLERAGGCKFGRPKGALGKSKLDGKEEEIQQSPSDGRA
jgi:hypothetical protein